MSNHRQPAALRRIAGNLTGATAAGADRVEAWYMLHPVQWPYRSTRELETSIDILTRGFAQLAGRDIHLRVSTVEYPVADWARRLNDATPDPADEEAWQAHLLASQQVLHDRPMSEPVVMVGVTIGAQSSLDRLAAMFLRQDKTEAAESARKRFQAELTAVDAVLTDIARPAIQRELEWLTRRSVGVGLPVPPPPPGTGDGPVTDDDLASFYDDVDVESPHGFARTVKITGHHTATPVERHVAVLSVGRMEEQEIPEKHTPWLARVMQFPGVEISARFQVMTGQQAASEVTRKIDRLMDEQAQTRGFGMEQKPHRDRVLTQAKALQDTMQNAWSDDAVTYKGQVRIAVDGDTPEHALARAHELKLHMRKQRIDLGVMRAVAPVLTEFVPGSKRVTTEYTRRMPARLFAASVPQLSGAIGDRMGLRRGYVISGASRQPFMWDLHRTMVEDGGRSGVTPVAAEQGAGKSWFLGATAALSCLEGDWVTFVDPPGTACGIAQWGPIADKSSVLDVMSTRFSPFALFPAPDVDEFLDSPEVAALEGKAALKRAWELAQDAEREARHERAQLTLDLMLAVLPHDPKSAAERELLLADAIHRTDCKATTTVEHVLAELATMAATSGDKATQQLSDALERIADLPRARNWMRSGPVNDDHLTAKLLAIKLDNLSLPATADPAEWDTSQRLGVSLLALSMHFAAARVWRLPRWVNKTLVFDESHLLAGWASMRVLAEKLNRQSRKYRVRVFYGSQDVDTTLTSEKLGSALVNDCIIGQLRSEEQQAKACAMLGIHPSFGAQIGQLRRGKQRAWLVRVNGDVGLVEWTLEEHPELMELLDTRPVEASVRDLVLAKSEGWFQ